MLLYIFRLFGEQGPRKMRERHGGRFVAIGVDLKDDFVEILDIGRLEHLIFFGCILKRALEMLLFGY